MNKVKINQLFYFVARFILGGIFIFASIDKIIHPKAFSDIIYNYQIAPDIFINIAAIILPWIELLTGSLLIIGFFEYGSVAICNLLLYIFFGALLFNLARGLNVSCGCFSVQKTANSSAYLYVLRDICFLFLSTYLFIYVFFIKRGSVKVS